MCHVLLNDCISISCSPPSSRSERPYDIEIILQGLAELKHVKDVLIGRLSQYEIMVTHITYCCSYVDHTIKYQRMWNHRTSIKN